MSDDDENALCVCGCSWLAHHLHDHCRRKAEFCRGGRQEGQCDLCECCAFHSADLLREQRKAAKRAGRWLRTRIGKVAEGHEPAGVRR